MANAIARQVLQNGPRNYIGKLTIVGDGSGEEAATRVNAVSGDMGTDNSLVSLEAACLGCGARLDWDATADVPLATLPADFEGTRDFRRTSGGIVNNAGAGKTGDIMITTLGLGAGDSITLVYRVKKKG